MFPSDDFKQWANVCDQCGRECGAVCRECLVCPEPAGYWAWSRDEAVAYLRKIDRAAEAEDDPQAAIALGAHYLAMSQALGLEG